MTVAARAIVPDNPASIAARVKEWCDVQKVRCFLNVHAYTQVTLINRLPPTYHGHPSIHIHTHTQLDAVFTSGGTGFAPRDLTPEAVKPLLDKEAPGVVYRIMEVCTTEEARMGPARS